MKISIWRNGLYGISANEYCKNTVITTATASMASTTAMGNVMATDMAMVKKSRNKYLTIYNLFLEKESRKGLFKTINIHSIIKFAEICPGMFPQIFFIYGEKTYPRLFF